MAQKTQTVLCIKLSNEEIYIYLFKLLEPDVVMIASPTFQLILF